MQRSSSSPPSTSKVTKLLTLSLRVRLAVQRKKLILVTRIHDLVRLVITLMTIGEGETVDLSVNQELHLLALTTTDQYSNRISAHTA